jgi:hypothetical protein
MRKRFESSRISDTCSSQSTTRSPSSPWQEFVSSLCHGISSRQQLDSTLSLPNTPVFYRENFCYALTKYSHPGICFFRHLLRCFCPLTSNLNSCCNDHHSDRSTILRHHKIQRVTSVSSCCRIMAISPHIAQRRSYC